MTELDQEVLTQASHLAWGAGIKILQGHRFKGTDVAHVAALLRFMAPKPKTTWVDVGCGFGEVARLMKLERPDLLFTLVNNNAYQLDRCPKEFIRVYADMAAMHFLPDAAVDGAMFLYSLCHAEVFTKVLLEAARVVKPGGTLFVYDYERLKGDNRRMVERLSARALTRVAMERILEHTAWTVTRWDHPEGDDHLFRDLFQDPIGYELIFKDLVPVLWKASRK